MKYEELYNIVKSPLDEPNTMNKLISAYAQPGDFYTRVTRINSTNKEAAYNKEAADALYSMLFNRWKSSITSSNEETIESAIKAGIYDKSIYKLIELLKRTPDVSTTAEANLILDKNYADQELRDAIGKYRWDSIGAYSEWIHIKAKNVHAQKAPSQKVEHSLSLNIERTDTHKMAKLFVDKCTKLRLPYYFKIREGEQRDDSVVIYSDTESLEKYIAVLKEIEKEHPDMIARCGNPPILTGKITNWIGYSSEPVAQTGQDSYNRFHAKLIEKAISDEANEWYKKNKNLKVTSEGREKSLYEYFAYQVAKRELKSMKNRLGKTEYTINENSKNYGYTEADLKDPAFCTKLLNEIGKKLPKIIENHINGVDDDTVIEIPVRDGKSYKVYNYRVTDTLRPFVNTIVKYDPGFVKRVKNRIVNSAKTNGIDSKKFCFNTNYDKNMKQAAQPQKNVIPKKEATKSPKEPEIPKVKPKPTEEEIHNKISKLATEVGCEPARRKAADETEASYGKYIKEYCANILFPAVKAKESKQYNPMSDDEIRSSQMKLGLTQEKYEPKRQPVQASGKKVETKAQPEEKTYVYKPMTETEILESRIKLGFEKRQGTNQNYRSQQGAKPKQETYIYTYKPMTEAEILKAREVIGEYKAPKVKCR